MPNLFQLNHKPILLYHKVDPQWEVGITSITPEHFKRQMTAVSQSEKILLPLEETLQTDAPENAVGLTFDDGYHSIKRYAAPILSKFGFRGTIFLIVDAIGKKNYWEARLAWRSFQHLDNNAIFSLIFDGWRIGSHCITHTSLTLLSDTDARREIVESKERLEQHFGQSVTSIAFPFGRVRQKHLEMALEAGYQWLCLPRIEADWSDDLLAACVLRRGVYRWESLPTFEEKCRNEALPKFHSNKLSIINKFAGGTVAVQYFRRIFS